MSQPLPTGRNPLPAHREGGRSVLNTGARGTSGDRLPVRLPVHRTKAGGTQTGHPMAEQTESDR
jgi:hypothetical protein